MARDLERSAGGHAAQRLARARRTGSGHLEAPVASRTVRAACIFRFASRWLGRQDSNLGSRDQNPLPYRLATPQQASGKDKAAGPRSATSPDRAQRFPPRRQAFAEKIFLEVFRELQASAVSPANAGNRSKNSRTPRSFSPTAPSTEENELDRPTGRSGTMDARATNRERAPRGVSASPRRCRKPPLEESANAVRAGLAAERARSRGLSPPAGPASTASS